MLSSKKSWPARDLAAGVYQSLETGDNVSHVGIFDPALWTVAPITFPLFVSTTELVYRGGEYGDLESLYRSIF